MAETKTTDPAESNESVPSSEEAQAEEIFVEDPSFEIDYKGDCAYEVQVSIPVANEKKQSDELLDELKGEAEVPGFRKGRAPRKLIERKFSKFVRNEVEGKLVSAAFQKLLKDHDLHPIHLPDVEGLDAEKERGEDEPVTCTFKFEVASRVELGEYKGLEVDRPVLKLAKKDVDKQIEQIRERHALYEPLSKNGKAKESDQVIIDFKGVVDGEAFQGGSADNYPYILGTKRFFPEFEEVLEGAKAGEELTCQVTFPDDYFNADLREKTADFTITIKEIKRRKLPDLDDEFAKQAGYESLEDLRTKVEEQMREGASSESDRVAEQHAIQQVIEKSTYEIPKSLIEKAKEDYLHQEIHRLQNMRVPMSAIEERLEEMREQSREAAINDIKRLVALNKIADVENIEATEADFEKEMESAAQRLGVDINVLGDYLGEDEERRNSYEDRIVRNKAIQVIMDNAKVTDKEVTREELEETTEDED